MASATNFSAAFFVSLNLLFFSLIVNPSSVLATCPNDAVKFGACVTALNGLVNIPIGSPPVLPCCSLIDGLVGLEAATCLCTTIKASIAGLNVNLPIYLSLLLGSCSKTVPSGFQYA